MIRRHLGPVIVGGIHFASVTALRRVVDEAVRSGGIDLGLARGLVDRHPYAETVRGVGIARATIETRRFGPCIVLTRLDGSQIAIKRRRCIDETESERFSYACRQAVFESIVEWKRALFDDCDVQLCALSGDLLSPDDADADHEEPWLFSVIVREFRAAYGERGTRAKSSDYDTPVFTDPEVDAAFRDFHDARAVLRLVRSDLNRSQGGFGQ
jgi:hypothetical protein